MPITRRRVLTGSAAGATAFVAGLARPAIGASAPIRIGCLPALTGPTSSTGIGMTRGTEFAVKEINASGGVNGRHIELVIRDTMSDPTKAVNAAIELTRSDHVDAVWGPFNSGEALAVMSLIARANVPQLTTCWADKVVDVKKYPMAFRVGPSNDQVGAAANRYVTDVLKLKKVAVIGDTTGWAVSSVATFVPMLKAANATVVYKGETDSSNPNLSPELLRMRDAGAEVIMAWSVNAGFLSRIINTRGQMGWNVPIIGHPQLGSGETKALLTKPEYWDKVYAVGFLSCSYGESGKLPPRTAAFVSHLHAAKVDVNGVLLWHLALGYDAPRLVAAAIRHGGSTPKQIAGYWNTLNAWPGIFADYTCAPAQHNSLPDDEVVMCQANSLRDGAFKLAPGYTA